MHGLAILIDDDRACGLGRHKLQNPISQLQPGVAQARLARDAAIWELILLPDEGEGLAALKVAPEVDLTCQKRCQVDGETLRRVAGLEGVVERPLKGQGFPPVYWTYRWLKALGGHGSVEGQGNLDAIFHKEREAQKPRRVAAVCHPFQAMPGAEIAQIIDPGQGKGCLRTQGRRNPRPGQNTVQGIAGGDHCNGLRQDVRSWRIGMDQRWRGQRNGKGQKRDGTDHLAE